MMETVYTTLKTYRTAWWVGVAMWAISFLFILGGDVIADHIEAILELLPMLEYNAAFDIIIMAAALLIPLTYLYLLLWFTLSIDWYLRNRREMQITTFDKVRWMAVILVLIMRPIVIIIDLT